ncbi:MAG: hypothetical protein K0R92_428 [Lachnospiraceae bacterium]|jgi:predicted RNA-binding Zn-ribbon protein involved in translation (DUF1610 family)|nr:hypothetical protein [Lachnospiraceae bacterium]
MKCITLIQILLFFVAYGQVGTCQLDEITAVQFGIRVTLLLGSAGVLQIIKILRRYNLTRKIECPVCGNEVERTYYSGEHGTEEEYYHCDSCGYGYEFAYGHHKEYINDKEFYYSYLTPEEDPVFIEIEEETSKLKLAVSTRNTHSRNTNKNNLLK